MTAAVRKPAPKRRKVIDVEKLHAEPEARDAVTGPDILDLMAENPTLDKVFDNFPDTLTDDEVWEYIDGERKRHAVFIEKDSE